MGNCLVRTNFPMRLADTIRSRYFLSKKPCIKCEVWSVLLGKMCFGLMPYYIYSKVALMTEGKGIYFSFVIYLIYPQKS
jgi:hypothetical protein